LSKRSAAVVGLIKSAKLNVHDPHAYLKDVLGRLPAQRSRMGEELLPQH